MKVVTLSELPGYPGPYPGIVHHVVANKESGFNNFEILYSHLPKDGIGRMHSHPHSEKLQLVLSGSLQIVSATDEKYDVPAGSGILFAPGEEHEVINTYDGVTEYIVVYSPGR